MKSVSTASRRFLTGSLIFFGGLLPLLALAPSGSATQQAWIRLSPAGEPPPPRNAGLTPLYDSSSNRLIIFGGLTYCCTSFNDVWVLTNANGLGGTSQWIKLNPTGSSGFPSPRGHHSAVYDSANNRMIIFSGGQFNGNIFSVLFNDVWVLTNANGLGGTPEWISLFPTGGAPTGRAGHRAVYDSASNRMIVFGGGNNGIMSVPNDVWVLTNANGLGGTPAWIQLNQTGQIPPPTEAHSATYDPTTNRMTIFGGCCPFTNAIYVLTNANGLGGAPEWIQLISIGTPPAARGTWVFGYHPTQNRLVIFGQGNSSGQLNDTWILTNANGIGGIPDWSNTISNGAPASPPSPVTIQGGAYDTVSNRLISVQAGPDVPAATGLEVWVLTTASGVSQNSDLAVSMIASANPVLTGSNVTYTITVTNHGPETATSVTVADIVPASINVLSCTSTGGVCSGSGNDRTITFASLPVGTSEIITISGVLDCSVADGTAISNMAVVSSSTTDPILGNNSAVAVITASNPPPTITCPVDTTSVTTRPDDNGTAVTYTLPSLANGTVFDNCGVVSVACNPPSGSIFPLGTTLVQCTAVDNSNNAASCHFTVTVNRCSPCSPNAQPITLRKMWPEGDYWKPETYPNHGGASANSKNFAVDFYYSTTPLGRIHNHPDLLRNFEMGIQGRSILAANSGKVFLYLFDVSTFVRSGNFDTIDADRVIQGLDPIPTNSFKFNDGGRKIDIELVVDSSNYRALYAHLAVSSRYFNDEVKQKMREAIADFLHNRNRKALAIDSGQIISAGEQVGTLNKWGLAKGYHLHFQVFKGDNFPTTIFPYGVHLGSSVDLSNPAEITLENQRIIDPQMEAKLHLTESPGFLYQYPAMPRRYFAPNELVIVRTNWDSLTEVDIFDDDGNALSQRISEGAVGVVLGQFKIIQNTSNESFHLMWKVQFQSVAISAWIPAEYLERNLSSGNQSNSIQFLHQ